MCPGIKNCSDEAKMIIFGGPRKIPFARYGARREIPWDKTPLSLVYTRLPATLDPFDKPDLSERDANEISGQPANFFGGIVNFPGRPAQITKYDDGEGAYYA